MTKDLKPKDDVKTKEGTLSLALRFRDFRMTRCGREVFIIGLHDVMIFMHKPDKSG